MSVNRIHPKISTYLSISLDISLYLHFSRLYSFFLSFSHISKKCHSIPKIHHFSYIKWDSIPKYTPKYHIKWGLHKNIEYNIMRYHVHTLKCVSSYYMQSYLLIFHFALLAQTQPAIHNRKQ